MGLFGFTDPLKEAGGWELTISEQEIEDMEKQGYDMSQARAKRAAAAAQKEAGDTAFAKRREDSAVPTDLNKLNPYCTVPRDTENDFFRDVAGKAPLFGKDKWKEKISNAPLIYGAVVQANSNLWLPGNESYLPVVLVFALDSAHIHNAQWLKDTAEKISEMKTSATVPADCQEFINILRDDQSDFCFPLGASLSCGADAWCVTYKFEKQTILPGNRLPEDGIVPFLLEAQPKKQIPIQMRPVPGKFYQA